MADIKNKETSQHKNPHPLYTHMLPFWELGHDSYGGEPSIKEKRNIYLPETSGMRVDGFGKGGGSATEGDIAYGAYLTRAHYPDVFAEAVESAVGVMHRKPPTIELTPKLQALFERASDDGEDIYLLLRKINAMQLITGRLGLLGVIEDVDNKPVPKLIVHSDRNCYNWDDSASDDSTQELRLLLIDESNYKLTSSYAWEWRNRTRVLALTTPEDLISGFDSDGNLEDGVYSYALLDDENMEIASASFEQMSYKGATSKKIPFSFINAKDLSSQPDKPPLDGLARLALAIYRGEADYRQNLFMQGQDTLVRIGATHDEDEVVRTGAGARIDVPVSGDAKYIGVSGEGLSEQREALKNDYAKAEKKASKLTASGSNESGEALKIRVAAQTATLPQIAQTGAAGLKKVLRDMATWLGENPDDIVVIPNLEFTDSSGDGLTLTQIVQSKVVGAPISDESIHAWMVEQGFTNMSYKEELAAVSNEGPRI